jgi:hypothetical protein
MHSSPGMRALRIDVAGRRAGYAYVSAEGHVGPLLATPEADETAVVLAAIREAWLERRNKSRLSFRDGQIGSLQYYRRSAFGSRNRCW